MARKVKDKSLDSKEARRKLKPQAKPYWRSIERGLHLGYRRLGKDKDGHERAGPWIARRYLGNQTYEESAIGVADDLSDADGVAVFDYWQAVNVARGTSTKKTAPSGPYTVEDAVRDYINFLVHERKAPYPVTKRLEAHVLPALGDIAIGHLTSDQIEKWHRALAMTPARVRSSRNGEQRFRDLANDADSIRRRRATANRALSELSAALNRAFKKGKIASDAAWKKVDPFRDVDAPRTRHLDVVECQRLLNACEPDFRKLVRAALETGARYSELCRLKVEDFNPEVGVVALLITKTGKPRHVVLTEDGISFFAEMVAGRRRGETMLTRFDGKPWATSHQIRPIAEACKRARIEPAITFHGLRHTYASLCVMAGMLLPVLAQNLGHSGTAMIEKHYGHLAPSFVVDQIRAHAPRFGTVKPKVKAIR